MSLSFSLTGKVDPNMFHEMADDNPGTDHEKQTEKKCASDRSEKRQVSLDSRTRNEMIHALSSESDSKYVQEFLLRRLLSPVQYEQYVESQDDKGGVKARDEFMSSDSECDTSERKVRDQLSDRNEDDVSSLGRDRTDPGGHSYGSNVGSSDKQPPNPQNTCAHNSYDNDENIVVERHQSNDNYDKQSSSSKSLLRGSTSDRPAKTIELDSEAANTRIAGDGGTVSKSSQSIEPDRKRNVETFACSVPSDIGSVSYGKSSQSRVSEVKSNLDKYPDIMNILVMGETGVGKSTFINGIVNYLNYDTMDEALRGGVEVLIESAFTLTDNSYNPHIIRTKATIGVEKGRTERSNESDELGQSATQEPKSYVFSFGSKRNPKRIRIIDTPGIGDTRGIEQDEANFEKILHFISNFSEIHGICILIKPNTARLSVAFRFCIDELLAHLHKSASENILFCFTHTRGSLYKPGDTLPILKQHLENLQRKKNIAIELSKSTVFSFDNESFRFLCAKKAGYIFSEDEKSQFEKSWKRSKDETRRLFDRASQLVPHSVRDTLSLNNTRNTIEALLKPLVSIVKTQMTNAQLNREKEQQVKEAIEAGRIQRDCLYVDQVFTQTIPLKQPQTVCTSERCVKRIPIGESGRTINDYVTVCHNNCHLSVQVEKVPNPDLKACLAMKSGVCTNCGCLWDKHMHITYRREETVEKVEDRAVKESIRRRDKASDTIKILLNECRRKVKEIDMEFTHIRTCCAEFAVFLTANSLITYSDLFIIFIDHAIREEEDMVRSGKDKRLWRDLVDMKRDYEKEVRFVKDSKLVRSVEQIDELISSLSRLKHCGSVIQDVNKIRLNQIQQSSQHEGDVIHLEKGGVQETVRYSRDRTDITY